MWWEQNTTASHLERAALCRRVLFSPVKTIILLTLAAQLPTLIMPKANLCSRKALSYIFFNRVLGFGVFFLKLLLTVITLFSRSMPPARLNPSPVSSSLCKIVT